MARGDGLRDVSGGDGAVICNRCRRRKTTNGRKTCDHCLRERREQYRFLKSLGVCPVCRRHDAGRDYTLCHECRAKFAERNATNERYAESVREAGRRWRQRNRAKGLCWCGRKPVNGYKQCPRCREKQRQTMRRRYERERKGQLWARLAPGEDRTPALAVTQ